MMIRRIIAPVTMGLAAVALVIGTANSKKSGDFFSHKLHIETVGLDCDACHGGAADATEASVNLLPPVEDCYACHEESDKFTQEYAAYEPPWRDVIFSHEQHLGQGMDCQDCHASVEQAEKVPSEAMPPMDMCVDCHNTQQVVNECVTCHVHVELIIPDNHGPDFVLDHVELARQGDEDCRNCHTQTYCQECHDGAALVQSVKEADREAMDRIGPMASAHEGKDILILQRVHDLNYRYTHGTDARNKAQECAVCHETTEFCVACHRPETDMQRNRPISHEMAGWENQGHADVARNDIEYCAGCHDETAAEPTCMRCHQRIVSPHPEGFMEDVHGDWHDDNSSVCFVCHDTRSRITGVGFCTACHSLPR
ncbi:MAG: hypothetical protein GF341_13345 [candidate division Zixibacteria bacterium]|nr:hypothetical protein [candidate division Zixibacteria bacterium]